MTDELSPEEQAALEEKEVLKEEATELGITFSGNIGTETLRKKIADHLEALASSGSTKPKAEEKSKAAPVLSKSAQRKALRRKFMRLRRIRISCMNPRKNEWPGQIFTFSNGVTGTIREMVPFDTDWHVPQVIYDMIKDKTYQTFYTVRDPKSGIESRRGKISKEFTIALLDDLTKEELADLAKTQAMSKSNEAA